MVHLQIIIHMVHLQFKITKEIIMDLLKVTKDLLKVTKEINKVTKEINKVIQEIKDNINQRHNPEMVIAYIK